MGSTARVRCIGGGVETCGTQEGGETVVGEADSGLWEGLIRCSGQRRERV